MGTSKDLTLIIVHPCELPLEYLRHCLMSLCALNSHGLKHTQVLVIGQTADTSILGICKECPIEITALCVNHPTASNGYPIWDVLDELRRVRYYVDGRYVCVMHSEFIWCKNRLLNTIEWLNENHPYLALGNLRRPGKLADMIKKEQPGCSKEISDTMTAALREAVVSENLYEWDKAAWLLETSPTRHWLHWYMPPSEGATKWQEDIFFADWEWLMAWNAFEHGGALPFQDIYDVMGKAATELWGKQALPEIYRMPLESNRVIHLWHPKLWGSWTPEVRDWFKDHAKDWEGTSFLDEKRWDAVIRNRTEWAPIADFRLGSAGTVTRYGIALRQWLVAKGESVLREFHNKRGHIGRFTGTQRILAR
jgi:hypothetical protein